MKEVFYIVCFGWRCVYPLVLSKALKEILFLPGQDNFFLFFIPFAVWHLQIGAHLSIYGRFFVIAQ